MARHPAFELMLSSKLGERATSPSASVRSDQVDACRRGDRAALEAVFRAHAAPLARLLTRIVGPSADVEDLLQDTFAEAIRAFPAFRGEASVKTWLHRIAIHVAHQHLRRPRTRREIALDTPDDAASHATHDTPETAELARHLYQHLEALDATKRIALVLYAVEGYTIDEIAALMSAGKAATRSRIFWARRALMKSMRRDPLFATRGER